MKSILIIGLGRFGKHMAMKLTELHHEVLAVDDSETRVNEALPFVTGAQIGDATNEQFIESLGVRNFDVCVVAIGDHFQSSLEATALLKDNGAPFVVARANREVHAKFLLRNGADEIVYPEKDSAIRAAVKYSSEHIFDYIELTQGFSIYETDVPPAWVGKNVVELAVRQKHQVSVLATKKDGVVSPQPGPEHTFAADERIFLLGADHDVMKVLKL